ncbi:MAG TPA: condensation domain-containing protein, partial [Pyrinomonadaceae bacterium]|nr:condensation domain-containing protein [Pyrinomonadaceae bacterium]
MSEHDTSSGRRENLQARRKVLTPEQQALLERRLRGTPEAVTSHLLPPIERVSRDVQIPLSYFQEDVIRVFFPGPQTEASPVLKCFRLQGAFNKKAFEQSLNALAARHEILRTTFKSINGKFTQLIASSLTVELPFIDLQHLPPDERLQEAQRLMSDQAFRPYDPTQETLWRSLLVQIGPDDHTLLLTMEHFISDAWSMDVMVRDTWIAYGIYASGSEPKPTELPIQYADFAHWQRNVLQGERLDQMISYWRNRLEGMGLKPEVHFPGETPLPRFLAQDDQEFANLEIEIPEGLTNSLQALSQKKNVTMYLLTLSALVALLYRYTGKEDIGVGSPVANRDYPATKEVLGWFVNTVILRFNLAGVVTFTDLMERVRTVVLETYEHHEVPIGLLQDAGLEPDEYSNPCVRFNMLVETKSSLKAQDFALQESPFSKLAVTPLGIPRPGPLTQLPGININLGMYRGGLQAVAF